MKRTDVTAIVGELSQEQLDKLMDLHGQALNSLRGKYVDYAPKSEFDNVTAELTALKKAHGDIAEITKELDELRTYKTETEARAVTDRKQAALTKALEDAKAHPKAVKLLIGKFDLNAIEIDDSGKVKNFDELSKDVKEEFSEFFGEERTIGVPPGRQTLGKKDGADPFGDVLGKYKEKHNIKE